MRKITLGLALASTALASPALARDGEWYVGIEGGVALAEDQDWEVNGVDDGYETETDLGFDADMIVGYDFGMFRLEAEGAYKKFDYDELTTNNSSVNLGAGGGFVGNAEIDGDLSVVSFMANGLLDFGSDEGVQGFVGGGAGIARLESDQNGFAGGIVDDSDTAFAWQALAGVRAPIGGDWDVGLKYRFFNVENAKLVDNSGRDLETDLRSHSILGSLIYNFGGEEEVAPAPVAPPAPPVTQPARPTQPTCNQGPYIVYFDWDVDSLDSQAASNLNDAIAQYRVCGNVSIQLAGHADRSGTIDYNEGLSARRNDSVREYLTAQGIPATVIASEAYGETRPEIETPDGVREPRNRRVEIRYGSGM